MLFNALWALPTEKVEEALCIKLPPCSHQLPREKPVPKPKPPTRWEAYAKSKGIDRKSNKSKGGEEGKAGRLVWNDKFREWLPKFGYKKAKAEQLEGMCRSRPGDAPAAPFPPAPEGVPGPPAVGGDGCS